MSKRLQIVMQEEEIEDLRRIAQRDGLTLSEWARSALERARVASRGPDPARKVAALDRALGCSHPTGAIAEMLSEIEEGRDLR